MALDAVNPSLAPASAGKARRKVAVDGLTILRDRTAAAAAVTTTETAIALAVENLGNSAIQLNGTCAGTVDGSNFWTLAILAADNSSLTSPTTVYTEVLPAAFDRYLAIDGRMLESIRAAGRAEATHIAVRVTKTGTTSTSCSYGAYIVPC